MDLLHENRLLLHCGPLKHLPRREGHGMGGFTQLFVLLFDNYCKLLVRYDPSINLMYLIVVITQPREHNGITRYHVYRKVSRVVRPQVSSLTVQ